MEHHKHAAVSGSVASKNDDSKAEATSHDFQLTATKNESRTGSSALADKRGNTHQTTTNPLNKFSEHFQRFGQLAFKKAAGGRMHDGRNGKRFPLMTKNQEIFLLSLDHHNKPMVELKARLVTAFAAARREAQLRQYEYQTQYRSPLGRIKELAGGSESERFVHMNVNRLFNKLVGIKAGQRGSIPMALLTMANHVALLAMEGATDHKDWYQQASAALGALAGLLAPQVGELSNG